MSWCGSREEERCINNERNICACQGHMDTEQRRQSDNHETCDLHKNRLNLNLGNHLTPDSRCVVLLIMTLASTFNCLYQCVYWLGAFSPIYAGSATFLTELGLVHVMSCYTLTWNPKLEKLFLALTGAQEVTIFIRPSIRPSGPSLSRALNHHF